MRSILAIILLFFIVSCSDVNNENQSQFRIVNNPSLSFEYYYDFGDNVPNQVGELKLKLDDFKVNGKAYKGFYVSGSEPVSAFALHTNSRPLDFNFLPIRYENGNYFEYRGIGEVVILMDNLKKGDVWSSEIKDVDVTLTYIFEVTEVFEVYNGFGIDYFNVYQIKETQHSDNPGSNGDQVSIHYYNKQKGIIRREMPVYLSGAYLPMVFNRVN